MSFEVDSTIGFENHLQVCRWLAYPGTPSWSAGDFMPRTHANDTLPGSFRGRLSARWIPKAGSDAMCLEALRPDDVNIAIQSPNPDHPDSGHLTTIRLTPDVRL